jgi:predicted Fe-Mo cluster-binding NifX family protein
VAGLGVDVLICGAISAPLRAVLAAEGVRVIPNRCGFVEEVLRAFLSGELTEQAFLMPGCREQPRQRRMQHRQRGGRP